MDPINPIMISVAVLMIYDGDPLPLSHPYLVARTFPPQPSRPRPSLLFSSFWRLQRERRERERREGKEEERRQQPDGSRNRRIYISIYIYR